MPSRGHANPRRGISVSSRWSITGTLLNQDTFSLQLLDLQERLVVLDKATLREYGIVRSSSMPSYRGKLTPQELADLVSYLATLRGRP